MADHKFIALLPVRDEADIVSQCIRALLAWADLIYVYDTGSVDGTLEIVRDFAQSDQRITIVANKPVYYNENRVRGFLFEKAREAMSDGDWFLRVDADEFHHVSPREFVRERMGRLESVAYHQYYDFALTDQEAGAWESGRETLADRSRPIEERRRHYSVSLYSEPRLCCYRSSMKWPLATSFPYNAGLVARARLPIRHYPHRDPAQLALRVRLRRAMMSEQTNRSIYGAIEHHWDESDWRGFIRSAGDPQLRFWPPGAALPDIQAEDHLPDARRRAVQRLFYALSLQKMADAFRTGWTEEALPLEIQPEVQARLASDFREASAAEEPTTCGQAP